MCGMVSDDVGSSMANRFFLSGHIKVSCAKIFLERESSL